MCGKKIRGPALAYLRERRLGAQYIFCCGLLWVLAVLVVVVGHEREVAILVVVVIVNVVDVLRSVAKVLGQ